MKLFTKIALGIAGFFAGMAVICAIIAFSMGFTTNDFMDMVYAGKFQFDFGNDIEIHLFDEDDEIELNHTTGHHGSHHDATEESSTKLDVEYGAGKLEIYYSDVSNITVEQEGVKDFRAEQEGDTFFVEGGLGITNNSKASLRILIPEGMQFEEIDLEIGASDANIRDLKAEEIDIVVGAGVANISNVNANVLNLEVGAGQANIQNLQVRTLDLETGVGKVNVEIFGAESDYNYNVECGIGEVKVGNHSYSGLGAEQNITNPNALYQMDIECGIGEVDVHFTK